MYPEMAILGFSNFWVDFCLLNSQNSYEHFSTVHLQIYENLKSLASIKCYSLFMVKLYEKFFCKYGYVVVCKSV